MVQQEHSGAQVSEAGSPVAVREVRVETPLCTCSVHGERVTVPHFKAAKAPGSRSLAPGFPNDGNEMRQKMHEP